MFTVCFFIFLLRFSMTTSNLVVDTKNGLIQGTQIRTTSGRDICAFMGIPYARAPVGPYRLKEPTFRQRWEGIYPTIDFNHKCFQFDKESPTGYSGKEDCLYLNIFTPAIHKSLDLEVIFFIHGGGFIEGSADMYTPDYLMDRHNIVFVTINYRLGPLGFLSLGNEVIPGNFGLKDQVLALKWVRQNIENFGGNKDKITIFGEDAGAASVHLHYLSPLSRHLFKHGISMGGSAFCPWALTKRPRLKAVKLAKSLGCDNMTSLGILDCFTQQLPHRLLDKTRKLFMTRDFLLFSPFGPVIEKKSNTAFLYDHPYKIIQEKKSKDAMWLVGYASHAGLRPGAMFVTNHDILEEIDEKWDEIAPILLDYNYTVPRYMLHSVNEKIRQFYFEDKEISVKLRRELITMLSDRLYIVGIERAARLQASVSINYVFIYRFGYRGRYSKAHELCNCTENLGASHGDELLYLFNHKELDVTKNPYEESLMKRMVDVIYSFLDEGIPKFTPETVWPGVKREAFAGHNIEFMKILTSQTMHMEKSADLGNNKFWSTLHLAELNNIVDEHRKFFDEL